MAEYKLSYTAEEIDEKLEKIDTIEEQVNNLSGGNVDQSGSIFIGKTASFYGDSLTEANYHYIKGYHSWVKDLLGLASYNNYGVSGYTVSNVYDKVKSVTDNADIIFVMCGVNDQNFSVPLGVMGDATTSTTYGALNMLCSLLKQKYPTKLVVFITPHYQTKYQHTAGVTSYEVSKAVREVCERYAIPVYDNFVLSGIYSTNLSTYTTDNCHWNNTAHEMVGKNLAKFVADSFCYVYGNTSGDGEETHTHSYTETVTTEATCTTAGVKTFTCACGDKYTQSVPATGHSWNAGVVTVEPTEETEGVRTYTCTVCGDTRTETIPTIEHAHSYVSKVIAPTCTEQGYTEHTCTSCGYSYKDTYVDAGHNYVDGVCSVCGAKEGAKTVEITYAHLANEWHLSLYVSKKDLPSINNTQVVWGFDIAPITDFQVQANKTGGYYTVDEVNNLLAGYTLVGSIDLEAAVTDKGNGAYSIAVTDATAKTHTNEREYWLFPVNMQLNVGNKFETFNYYVEVDGVRQNICAIGGAFNTETATITNV